MRPRGANRYPELAKAASAEQAKAREVSGPRKVRVPATPVSGETTSDGWLSKDAVVVLVYMAEAAGWEVDGLVNSNEVRDHFRTVSWDEDGTRTSSWTLPSGLNYTYNNCYRSFQKRGYISFVKMIPNTDAEMGNEWSGSTTGLYRLTPKGLHKAQQLARSLKEAS